MIEIEVGFEPTGCGVELEYRVCGVNGYKCRNCGHHLGSRADEEEMSDTKFEEYSFCPYCGALL